MDRNKRAWLMVCGVAATAAGTCLAQTPHTVNFDNGYSGWSISGRTAVDMSGNPDACLGEFLDDVWSMDIRTDEAGADVDPFLGDLSRYGSLRVSVDVRMDGIFNFFGDRIPRDLIVEFRDFNPEGSDYPWTSVWVNIGSFTGEAEPWRTFSVDIADPTSATLPAGWGGTGAESALGEPMLPVGRTFASVMASVDQVVFTTMVPGFFYAASDFDCRADNIKIEPIGSTACAADLDDGTGTGTPDDGVDINDLLYFLVQFEGGSVAVDLDNGTMTGTPDGGVDINDLLFFLVRFEEGC